MNTLKFFVLVFCLLFATQNFTQSLFGKKEVLKITSSTFLDLYPLHIGNFWQFKITVDSGFNNEDTTYYAYKEVLKDSLMPNGLFYKEVYDTRKHFANLYYYYRIDSTTGCIYEYSDNFNEEFLIDSLKMKAGDAIINGYGHMLECIQVDTIHLFGEYRERKHFFLYLIPIYYQNKYAEGLGEVYRLDHFEYIVGTNITSEITYAKINGIEFGELVSVTNNEHQLNLISLFQNYPNPFNPNTKIEYQIPELSSVTIKVYNVLGNEVTTLVNEEKLSGTYEVEFDGIDLPSGIYFYQIKAGSFVDTKKMLLIK